MLLPYDHRDTEEVADRYFAADLNTLLYADQEVYAASVRAACGAGPAAVTLRLQAA